MIQLKDNFLSHCGGVSLEQTCDMVFKGTNKKNRWNLEAGQDILLIRYVSLRPNGSPRFLGGLPRGPVVGLKHGIFLNPMTSLKKAPAGWKASTFESISDALPCWKIQKRKIFTAINASTQQKSTRRTTTTTTIPMCQKMITHAETPNSKGFSLLLAFGEAWKTSISTPLGRWQPKAPGAVAEGDHVKPLKEK